jgi:hypothetical protein
MNNNFNRTNVNQDLNEYSLNKFLYNNALFITQALVSFFGLGFSAAMLIQGRDTATYLPIMTSILFYWTPSPLNHKIEQPSGVPQIREIISRV